MWQNLWDLWGLCCLLRLGWVQGQDRMMLGQDGMMLGQDGMMREQDLGD
ncbi:MAG: hypothetical protein AAFQ92_04415 [Bacteroidota bacterium]